MLNGNEKRLPATLRLYLAGKQRGSIVRNPCIGLREPLMAERPEGFRSVVVHRNCKLVYYVDGDTVYIADVWDTRREPLIQADNVK